MNTPAHLAINLLALSRREKPQGVWPIVIGAIIPDLTMIGFYFWHKLQGVEEAIIWNERYPLPEWQLSFDVFNSLPLIAGLALITWHKRVPWLALLAASMALHVGLDLPLHHDDAHRHFWPLTDWRFISPVSYWDPNHHGQWVSLLEFVLVILSCFWLSMRFTSIKARLWIGLLAAGYLSYGAFVFLVWA